MDISLVSSHRLLIAWARCQTQCDRAQGQRHAKKFLEVPRRGLTADLLKQGRANARILVGLLIGHNKLQKGWEWAEHVLCYCEGLSLLRFMCFGEAARCPINPLGQRLLIDTKGCRIPDFDAINPDIEGFFNGEDLNCDNMAQLVKGTTSELYVDESRLYYYNCSRETLKCCFRPFWRVDVERKVNDYDNHWEFSKDCYPFFEPIEVLHEFVKVSCSIGNETIYKDYFAFVQRKKDKQFNPNDRSKVSVLTFGLDGVSRLNLHRHLPKTVALLHDLGAVEMLGFNKVGDNTFPNLIPVLTGHSSEELEKLCLPNDRSPMDDCPFIWNGYHENGYQTGFGEDAYKILLFNLHSAGFKKKPTDFYMTPFTKASEKDIGREGKGICNVCLGNRLIFESLLDTVQRFSIVLKDILSFGFFWSNSLSHDFLNLPMHIDDPFFTFLNVLKKSGILEKTVIIFMSDHGIRYGKYRQTYQGYVEERLPFLFILYPKWFEKEFPKAVWNLKRNRKRLTTPYDLHETYKSLLDLKSLKLDQKPTKMRNSLFSPISEERTCSDAGIPFDWCTCNKFSTPEMLNDSKVLTSGYVLVQHLNRLLSDYAQCAKLNISSIISARSEKSENHYIVDYTIIVETMPGKNYFQGTVRNTEFLSFQVLPPVSRINTYGEESKCIANRALKLYCYCVYK